MTDTSKLLSQLAYAKHRGVTHGAVAKAIKTGRLRRALITDADGKVRIDPTIADTEWQANTSPAMQRGNAGATPAPSAPTKPAKVGNTKTTPVSPTPASRPAPSAPSGASSAAGDEDDAISMADARAMKERYLALLAQLDYQVKAGILIEAKEARQAGFALARKARDMLLTIADRVAPVVAGLDNQFECHRVITAEIKRVMEELNKNPLDGLVPEAADAGH